MAKALKKLAPLPTKIDIGCGKNKKEGFYGIDACSFEGVDLMCDLTKPWPIDDDSIEEAHCSHFLEHLERRDRVRFMNELYRVMKKDAKCTIVVPHWCSNRAYGDMSHCWPPVSEMFFYYLDKGWRKGNAPHDDFEFNPEGYRCDFLATWGYGMHTSLLTRSADYQQHALQFWKEAALDLHATLTKR